MKVAARKQPEIEASRSALCEAVLVLNRSWIPVGVATVREALCMMAREIAQAVEPDSYELHDLGRWMALPARPGAQLVHSVSVTFPAPEILHLVSYDRIPRQEAAFSKRNIYIRDRATCQYCGTTPGAGRLTIDHILPRSRGGSTSWENCVLACKPCNNRKADRTPGEAGLDLRGEPHRPAWRSFLHGMRSRPSWRPFLRGVDGQ